jgi:enoyl-CoA hydratase/carnithine racemase
MAAADEIILGREGGVATVTINRPQALNALTLANYRRIAPALPEWAAEPAVRAVLVRSAGGRAFCAGGDVAALYEAGRGIGGDPALTAVFFAEEYRLIHDIHRLPKPYIAIVDGITMGGGAGISVNGAYAVATEQTLFAMPETAIGLFPDVGATRFLNRCPGQVGRYLGLGGARIRAADALYCGFVTHYVPRQRIPGLVEALAGLAWRDRDPRVTAGRDPAIPGHREARIKSIHDGLAQVGEVLDHFAADPGPAPLAVLRPTIDRCFVGDDIETILAALAAEGGEWAEATRAGLLTKSPTSLKVTLRQLQTGRDYDLDAALVLEYRLTQHFMAGHDFYEGVRAALIDKDQTPHWRPASLAEVDAATVASYFAAIGERELRFT